MCFIRNLLCGHRRCHHRCERRECHHHGCVRRVCRCETRCRWVTEHGRCEFGRRDDEREGREERHGHGHHHCHTMEDCRF